MRKKRASQLALVFTLLAGLLVAAAAEAQDELFVTNIDDHSVTVYSRTASGNTAPLRTLRGAATGLIFPTALALDRTNNEIFVVSGVDNSITVHVLTASGNTAPLRTLRGAATGLNGPIALALDLAHNELFVSNVDGRSVTVYTLTASGNTAPLRTLSGAATGLLGSGPLVLDLANNELVVGSFSGPSFVFVYSRTASGNTAPLRTLSGAATGLSLPAGLALDLMNDELIVTNQLDDSVTVYSRTASGNTAPLRTLRGPATGLNSPGRLVLDLATNELVILKRAIGDNSVIVHSRTASGNTAPLRTLNGAATGLNGPAGLALTPRLSLLAQVNGPTFSVGSKPLTLTVGVVNPGLPVATDLYLGILRPDGTIEFFTGAGSVFGSVVNLASFRPVATGVSLAVPFSVTVPNFFSRPWTGAELRGDYAFFFFAVTAGALADGILTGDEVLGVAAALFAFP